MNSGDVQSLGHEHAGSVANPCRDIHCELRAIPAVATDRRRQCNGVK
jgi:hypothetical protein